MTHIFLHFGTYNTIKTALYHFHFMANSKNRPNNTVSAKAVQRFEKTACVLSFLLRVHFNHTSMCLLKLRCPSTHLSQIHWFIPEVPGHKSFKRNANKPHSLTFRHPCFHSFHSLNRRSITIQSSWFLKRMSNSAILALSSPLTSLLSNPTGIHIKTLLAS